MHIHLLLFSLCLFANEGLVQATPSDALHGLAHVKARQHGQEAPYYKHRRRSSLKKRATCHSYEKATNTTNATNPKKSPKPSKKKGNCFPYGASFKNATSKAPTVSRSTWWCDASRMYGFLGFSYPLEVTDCSDPSNGYDAILSDFQLMKKNYGARFVRIYAPQCREQSIWTNLAKAGIATDMAVIPQIWWGFDGNGESERKVAQAALLKEIQQNPAAPYVFHHVEFGSEPIGDGVDGGIEQFTTDFISFKKSLKASGIPATVSEDYYRTGSIINGDGSFTSDGQKLVNALDLVDAHIMPYYASDVTSGASAWSWIAQKLAWYKSTQFKGKQIMITETMWASSVGAHGRPAGNQAVTVSDAQAYWANFNKNCATFKKDKVGWFVHVLNDQQETGFGILDANNKPKFPFKVTTC